MIKHYFFLVFVIIIEVKTKIFKEEESIKVLILDLLNNKRKYQMKGENLDWRNKKYFIKEIDEN